MSTMSTNSIDVLSSHSKQDNLGPLASKIPFFSNWIRFLQQFDIDPKTLVILVATVDAADLALVAASYKAFETDFGFTPRQLGLLSAAQGFSYALALPFWGMFLPRLGCRFLLCGACLGWMFTTFATPFANWFAAAILVRVLNGAALSGVMPISQAIIADVTEEQSRGQAFGCMQSLHQLAKVIVSYYVISMATRWAECYFVIGFITLMLFTLIYAKLPESYGKNMMTQNQTPSQFLKDSWDTMKKIVMIPSFCILVLQGISGGTPWQAMSFLNLYWVTRGFSHEQAARVSALTQCGGIFGVLFGGWLGDQAARKVLDDGLLF